MATRSTIKIEGIEFAKVYKHYDGYPSEMLEKLKDFNKDFEANRGEDARYKFAQLLRHSTDIFNDDSAYTGWGLVELHDDCGEEYEYTLLLDGSVTYKAIQ